VIDIFLLSFVRMSTCATVFHPSWRGHDLSCLHLHVRLAQEVELAVKLKRLRSLPPSASVDAEHAELMAEVASVTAEMRALGVPAPGAPPT